MIIALDTSGAIAVSVMDGDRVLAERSAHVPRGHAERLAPMVAECMDAAGVTGADASEIVVGTGPGPFTGLRVGLMTARMLAHTWGVPVRGCCSLDAVGAAHGGQATVIADARRREVYWATYAAGERVSGPAVDAPADVPILGDAVGRGAVLYSEHFPGAVHADPDPAWLARVVAGRLAAGEEDFPLAPLYLRRPEVHGGPRA